MADSPVVSPVLKLIDDTSHPWWKTDERIHALDQARLAPVPSRLEEEWRRTDPEAFPWSRIEESIATIHQNEVSVSHDFSQVISQNVRDAFREMQLIAGDDYDAKFLYYHRALDQSPVAFHISKDWSGGPIEIIQAKRGMGLSALSTTAVIEEGAEVTIIERWNLLEENALAIGRVEIDVQPGAKLTYIQEEDCGHRASLYKRIRIRAEQDASVKWYTFTRGADWHVARLELVLAGSGAEGLIRGLFAGSEDSRTDHRTHQDHAAPNAKSDLLFKTLLSGRAHSIYQGLISVPQRSQKTDAYQQCRNLLLDPGTHADAIPKLEIIADDVRCTHGASVGSLNSDHLFYLQSRGLSRAQAARTIAMGFAEEVISRVPIKEIQEHWRSAVTEQVQIISQR